MQLPTVTENDLLDFHRTHFSHDSTHVLLKPSDHTEEPSLEQVDGYDDGLGFYADGVKRTLTDEQISMFRHSEIQTILRQRRHAREALQDQDDKDSTRDQGAWEMPAFEGSARREIEDASIRPETMRQTNRTSKKRKRNHNPQHRRERGGGTDRRLAREADEANGEAMVLDYGDGEAMPTPRPVASTGGKEEDTKPSHPNNPAPLKGGLTGGTTSKFVWPSLGQ